MRMLEATTDWSLLSAPRRKSQGAQASFRKHRLTWIADGSPGKFSHHILRWT